MTNTLKSRIEKVTDRRVEGVTGQIKEEAEIPGLNRADRGRTAALGDLIGV